MSRTACYVRVSTSDQAEEGCSLEAQEARLLSLYPDALVFREVGVSGSVPIAERPEGRRLVAAIEAGEVNRVCAVALSRLFRSASDAILTCETWTKKGVSLQVLDLGLDTATALGKFAMSIMAAVAELERSMIASRTKAAMAHLRKQGREFGRTSRYRRGHPLTATVERLVARGEKAQAIADYLNARGMRTLSGLPFTPARVRELRRSLRRSRKEAC